MITIGFLTLHVLEAVFAYEELGLLTVFVRIGRKIPSVDLVGAKMNFVYVS